MTNLKDSRQLDVLQFIYKEVQGTVIRQQLREICNAVQLSSTSTVHGHLSRLEKNGLIQRDPSKPRAIELTMAGLKAIGAKSTAIPMLGVVTAGEPILAVEEARTSSLFQLELQMMQMIYSCCVLKGDSMINAGIFDGDSVIVRKQSTASNGEIVIAMTEEDTATCKRFFLKGPCPPRTWKTTQWSQSFLPNCTILGK